MKSIVTLNDIERMKDALRASLPDVKSSHRVEALARGLGWATNASMRAALSAAPAETSPDEGTFLDYLRLHSFDAPGGTLLRAFAQAGLRRAMDLAPQLSGFGYRVTLDRGETPKARRRASWRTARRCSASAASTSSSVPPNSSRSSVGASR